MRTAVIALAAFAASTTAALADPCEAPLPAKGTPFAGVVTYIVDGDGLCVGQDEAENRAFLQVLGLDFARQQSVAGRGLPCPAAPLSASRGLCR